MLAGLGQQCRKINACLLQNVYVKSRRELVKLTSGCTDVWQWRMGDDGDEEGRHLSWKCDEDPVKLGEKFTETT